MASLEILDLASLTETIPEVAKGRVLHCMGEVHARNMKKVQLLENLVREIYSIAAGLVNDGMEVIRRYGKLATALDVRQQQILRMCDYLSGPTPSSRSASLQEASH